MLYTIEFNKKSSSTSQRPLPFKPELQGIRPWHISFYNSDIPPAATCVDCLLFSCFRNHSYIHILTASDAVYWYRGRNLTLIVCLVWIIYRIAMWRHACCVTWFGRVGKVVNGDVDMLPRMCLNQPWAALWTYCACKTYLTADKSLVSLNFGPLLLSALALIALFHCKQMKGQYRDEKLASVHPPRLNTHPHPSLLFTQIIFLHFCKFCH